jgi:myo-inositol-1(or 4)-monophosphatase
MKTNDLDMRFAAACAIAREAGVLARKRFCVESNLRSHGTDFKTADFLTAPMAEVGLIRGSLERACFRRLVLRARRRGWPSSATSVDPITTATANCAVPSRLPHFAISDRCFVLATARVEIGRSMHGDACGALHRARAGRDPEREPLLVSVLADIKTRQSCEAGWSPRSAARARHRRWRRALTTGGANVPPRRIGQALACFRRRRAQSMPSASFTSCA